MPSHRPTNSPSAVAPRPTLELYRELVGAIRLDNGQPFVLDEWEEWVAADLLTGVREVHVRIPEENGKTTFVAADNLIHLVTHPRPRAVVAARNEKQAKILYLQAVAMASETPELDRRLLIREGTNEIRLRGRRGDVGLAVIPSDELSAHGAINTRVTIDEMHALPGIGMYRVLSRKLGKREGAQLVAISTAGEPDSEYEQMWAEILASPAAEKRGPRVTRVQGPQHVAWCWALERDDDVEDMAVVKLANPLHSITPATLQAKRDLPGHNPKHWLQVVCNVPTRDFVSRFLPEAEWTAAGTDEQIPPGEPVTLGIDWGWIDDATAIVPLWRRPFAEGEAPELPENDDIVVADQMLTLGPATILEPPRNGTQLDPETVKAALLAIDARNPVEAIAHDGSAMGGGHLMTGWLEENLPNATVIPVKPADVADANGHFLEQLRVGALQHTRDPDLTRHLLNAIRLPIADSERFHLRRPKESRHAPHQRVIREIDAAVAAVLAVWGTVGAPPPLEPFILVI